MSKIEVEITVERGEPLAEIPVTALFDYEPGEPGSYESPEIGPRVEFLNAYGDEGAITLDEKEIAYATEIAYKKASESREEYGD